MIELVNWNIQWGRGMDGVVDLGRIVETVSGLSDWDSPDIICFQEITRNLSTLAGPRSLSNDGADQPAVLAGLLPGFEAIYGPGTDLAGKGRGTEPGPRRQFGNLVLSRLPASPRSWPTCCPGPQRAVAATCNAKPWK